MVNITFHAVVSPDFEFNRNGNHKVCILFAADELGKWGDNPGHTKIEWTMTYVKYEHLFEKDACTCFMYEQGKTYLFCCKNVLFISISIHSIISIMIISLAHPQMDTT